MAQMQSLKPARKVTVGALSCASATLIVWLIETIGKTTVPAAVAIAITTVITFVLSYLVPPSPEDQVIT